MVVEIAPGTASASVGKPGPGGDSKETPASTTKTATATALRLSAVGRVDSTEIPPGMTAAMAVTGKQSTSEGGDSDSTTVRQPPTTSQ